MNCAKCGNEFTGRKRKYCTKDCYLRAYGHDPDYKPEPNCLMCGKPLQKGQKKYCSNACCARAYTRRKGRVSRAVWMEKIKNPITKKEIEKQQRDLLTDKIVKRNIYITTNRQVKGSIKYNQITPDMIAEKRAQILAWREQRAEIPGPSCKVYFPVCNVCGRIFTARANGVGTCSDDCRKKKARQDNYTSNKAKKGLKERICNECGELFIPEYGDKRRGYCSNDCMTRHARRNGKHIRRERFKVAFRERVYKAQVYRRDVFRCQICKGKVNMKANVPHPLAPTMDHIIALANGGKHEPSNVRLTHFMCNSRKGDRVTDGGDQLLLFG